MAWMVGRLQARHITGKERDDGVFGFLALTRKANTIWVSIGFPFALEATVAVAVRLLIYYFY